MSCNCENNNHQNTCDNSITFKLDGSYLVPFCGSTPMMPLDLSPVVQDAETDTRLQLDQALKRLVYTGELAQRGVSSPDSIAIADIANLIPINELENVQYAVASNGDILSWDSNIGKWVSYTIPSDTIVTPVGVGADGNLVKDGSGGTPQAPDTVPLGAIIVWPGDIGDIPVSYREANGQALSRSVYSDLFAVYGTKYGAGDGSTTFNVPNIGSRQISGYNPNDTQYEVIGQTGGAKTAAHVHGSSSMVARMDLNPARTYVQRRNTSSWNSANDEVTTWGGGSGSTRNAGIAIAGNTDSANISILDQYITMPYILRAL